MKVSKFKRYTYVLPGLEDVQVGLVTYQSLRMRLLNINGVKPASEEELHEASFSFGSKFGEWLDKEWVEEVGSAEEKKTDFQVLEERFLSKLKAGQDYLIQEKTKFDFVFLFNSDKEEVAFSFNKDGSFRHVE